MNITDQGRYFSAGYFACADDRRCVVPDDVPQEFKHEWLRGWRARHKDWSERNISPSPSRRRIQQPTLTAGGG